MSLASAEKDWWEFTPMIVFSWKSRAILRTPCDDVNNVCVSKSNIILELWIISSWLHTMALQYKLYVSDGITFLMLRW